jgi:hypothetical protein
MNYYRDQAVRKIAVTPPSTTTGAVGELLMKKWLAELAHSLGPATRQHVARLPPIEDVFEQAWEGALQMLRDRGEDPTAIVETAAAGMRTWIGQDDEGPIDPDEL